MELSEEEKKAIEYIKEFKNEVFEGVGNKSTMAKNIDILLNLIKSQQEEIEERETRLQEEINENCKLKTELYGNSISKDKIRERIKEARKIRWHIPKLVIEYFEEFLEEN